MRAKVFICFKRLNCLIAMCAALFSLAVLTLFLTATEVRAKGNEPKVVPLVMNFDGEPKNSYVIEPLYQKVGKSVFKVYLVRKQKVDKKVMWKTWLYIANYPLVSLFWSGKSHQYVYARDSRNEEYYVDVETGKRVAPTP